MNTLYIKLPKKKFYSGRAYSIIAPKLWISVPVCIRLSKLVNVFKKNLKTYLFTIDENLLWIS